MLFGGYRGLLQARTSTPSPIPTTSARHRLAVFFVRESILTGARVGLFASVFSAVSLAAHASYGDTTPGTFAAAGALTCGLFGGAAAGRVAVPAAAGFGAVTAGALGVAQASLEDAYQIKAGEAQGGDLVETAQEGEEQGSVAIVVNRLEDSLKARPAAMARREQGGNTAGDGGLD